MDSNLATASGAHESIARFGFFGCRFVDRRIVRVGHILPAVHGAVGELVGELVFVAKDGTNARRPGIAARATVKFERDGFVHALPFSRQLTSDVAAGQNWLRKTARSSRPAGKSHRVAFGLHPSASHPSP